MLCLCCCHACGHRYGFVANMTWYMIKVWLITTAPALSFWLSGSNRAVLHHEHAHYSIYTHVSCTCACACALFISSCPQTPKLFIYPTAIIPYLSIHNPYIHRQQSHESQTVANCASGLKLKLTSLAKATKLAKPATAS